MYKLRKLLYDEKTLSNWEIDTESTLSNAVYSCISDKDGYRPLDKGCEENICIFFNDATFMCIQILYCYDKPHYRIGDLLESIEECFDRRRLKIQYWEDAHQYSIEVLVAAYYFLTNLTGYKENNLLTKTASEIDKALRNDDYGNWLFKKFFEKMEHLFVLPDSGFDENFKKKELSIDDLAKVDWYEITNEYDIDRIRFVVRCLGNDDTEKLNVINAIEQHVRNTEQNDQEANLPF